MSRQERRRQAREAPRLPASPQAENNAMAFALAELSRQQAERKYTEAEVLRCIEAGREDGRREGYDAGWQLAAVEIVKSCYAAIGIVLHEQYGFGQERILRAMKAMDHEVALCIEHRELCDKFYQACGMQLDFDDMMDRVTIRSKRRMRRESKQTAQPDEGREHPAAVR